MNIDSMSPGSGRRIDENNKIRNIVESVTGSIKTIPIDHTNIHEGKSYSAFNKSTIASGATLSFSFKTPTVGYVHYRPAGIFPSGDNINLDLYEGAAINLAGTTIISSNRNRISTEVALSEIKVGTTFTTNGTLVPGLSAFLPGTTGAGQTRSGNISQGNDEIILKKDTVYRLVAINGSTAANTVGFNFNWYEES